MSVIDWVQATGRAGRSGKHALCVALVAAGGRKEFKGDMKDETFSGKMSVKQLFTQSECLRAAASRHLDGREVTCLSLLGEVDGEGREDVAACSWCSLNVLELQYISGEASYEREHLWSLPRDGKCVLSLGD